MCAYGGGRGSGKLLRGFVTQLLAQHPLCMGYRDDGLCLVELTLLSRRHGSGHYTVWGPGSQAAPSSLVSSKHEHILFAPSLPQPPS